VCQISEDDGVACCDADDDCTNKSKEVGVSMRWPEGKRKHASSQAEGRTWLFRPKAVWDTVIDADCVGVALNSG